MEEDFRKTRASREGESRLQSQREGKQEARRKERRERGRQTSGKRQGPKRNPVERRHSGERKRGRDEAKGVSGLPPAVPAPGQWRG